MNTPMRSHAVRPVWVILSLLLPWRAAAQAALPSFDLDRLDLDAEGAGSLVLGGGELKPGGAFRVSLASQYERNPLLAADQARGEVIGAVVRDRLAAHLGISYAIHRRFEADLSLRFVPWQTADAAIGTTVARPATVGFASPTLGAKVALLTVADGFPLDLALHALVSFPVGSGAALLSDDDFGFTPRLVASYALSSVTCVAEVGALLRATKNIGEPQAPVELGNQLEAGLAATVALGAGFRAELAFRALQPLTDLPRSGDLLAGVRMRAGPGLELFALGGPGLGTAPGTPAFRAFAGVGYGFTPAPPPPSLDLAPPELPMLPLPEKKK